MLLSCLDWLPAVPEIFHTHTHTQLTNTTLNYTVTQGTEHIHPHSINLKNSHLGLIKLSEPAPQAAISNKNSGYLGEKTL